MNDQRYHVNFFAGFVAISLALVLAGCGVGVPSKASVNVRRADNARIDEGVMVSLGPRKLLERLSKEIVSNNEKIEVVDGLLFRDTAFPEGNWSLERLLEPEVRSRVGDVLRVDYLVLLGTPESTSGEEEGFFIPMAVGAMSVEGSTKISASVIDLKTGKLVTQIDSVASGKGHILYYVIIVVGNEPQTVTGAIDGLAKEISDVLLAIEPAEKIRVAVLATEQRQLSSDGEKSVPREVAEAVAALSHKTKQLEEAEKGDLEAQLQQYYNQVNQAPAEAHRWLCKSADQGHPDARYRLALLYEHGNEGIERDYIRAYMWYVLAAETGSYWAGTHLQRLTREHLSPDETVAAKQGLREWKPGQCESDLGLVPEQ